MLRLTEDLVTSTAEILHGKFHSLCNVITNGNVGQKCDLARVILCNIFLLQSDVECIFLTDNLNSSHESYPQVMREQDEFGDMRFQNIVSGFLFGLRYIYHLVYAFLNYDFQYILRTDDDYFICLDRLLYELPSRTLPMFHWGYVHLDRPSVIRPDESIAMFSKDVIARYLFQDPSTLYCHAMGGQQVALWTANLNIKKIFRHDSRLLHDDIIRNAKAVLSKKSFCEKYIGIHRSLPNYMMHFWKYRYSSNSKFHFKGNLMTNLRLIDTRGVFNWNDFGPEARYEPQLCIKKSVWTSHQWGHPGENGTFYPGFIEYRLGEKLSEWLENPNYSQFEKLGGFDFIQDVASTRKHDKHNNSKDQ